MVPFIALGTILLLGTIFGRAFCGWVCPFGLLQDLLHKIPSPNWVVKRWMRSVKYVLLVVSVLLVPFFWGIETKAFFCKLCPTATLESLIPRALIEGNYASLAAGWIRILVFAGFIILAIVSLRSFCKIFCPIGAILAICNRFSGYSLRYEPSKCSSCKRCLKECPMDIQVEEFRRESASSVVTVPSECILCLHCTKNCKEDGMNFSFWGLRPRSTEGSSGAVDGGSE
jgi:polyferredoxin